MVIGKIMIDTNSMSLEEVTAAIETLRKVRTRKAKARELIDRMNDVIREAQEYGFAFIDNTCGFVREPDDFNLYDGKA